MAHYNIVLLTYLLTFNPKKLPARRKPGQKSVFRPGSPAVGVMECGTSVVKVDRWHYTTTILRLRIVKCKKDCFLIPEINEVSRHARTISRHADGISRYSVPASAGPLLPL